MFRRIKSWLPFRTLSDDEYRRQRDRLLDRAPVPVFWLFGKTGSGKTSIVKYLTGAERAEIGSGFRPQTQRSEQYDFPSAESPLVRFLDTRGLGETRYDPREDIGQFSGSTHVVIVTVRAMDHALAEIIEPLRAIRKAAPARPVLLALTCLHEAYPGQQHPDPDPFDSALLSDSLPVELRRSIGAQEERFAGLADRIVPLDLTQPEDGFDQPDFGGGRLTGCARGDAARRISADAADAARCHGVAEGSERPPSPADRDRAQHVGRLGRRRTAALG